MKEVRRQIRAGVFSYAEMFPHSRRAPLVTRYYADVAQEWLASLEGLADATLDDYEKILNYHWLPELGQTPVDVMTPGQVKRAIGNRKFKTAKRRNNCVSVLKMSMQFGVGERYYEESPAADVDFLELPDPDPDPFSVEEALALIGWLREKAPEQSANYFHYGFFSGLRTSELLQLQWPKVDLLSRPGYVRVDEAMVRKRTKGTKTSKVRDVELNDESRAALVAQRRHTGLADRHVFLNPYTGAPYFNDKAPRDMLDRAQKALGIRRRPAYNVRHTFATMNLMAGANPYWVSKQMGHASLEMTLKVYSKWIKGADHGREIAKLGAFLEATRGSVNLKRAGRMG